MAIAITSKSLLQWPPMLLFCDSSQSEQVHDRVYMVKTSFWEGKQAMSCLEIGIENSALALSTRGLHSLFF